MSEVSGGTSPQAVALELAKLILAHEVGAKTKEEAYSRDNVIDVFKACYFATKYAPT